MNLVNFNELYKQYYKKSFLFVKSYLRDDMASEDVVSESLIIFWQTLQKEKVEHPNAFLLAILKNGALNYLKHQDICQTAFENLSCKMKRDLHYRITTLQACDPEEVFSSEITAIVTKTLSSLPPQTRQVFEMSRYEYRSVKEIAEKLSLSTKSVEYHITRSLKSLRIALKEYLPLFYFLFN